jgi:spore germination protein YaaH
MRSSNRSGTLPRLAALLLPAALAACAEPDTPPLEAIWYVRNDSAGIASFDAHAERITAIAPQVYSIDSAGRIRGSSDPRIIEIAREKGVKHVPLVMNPGFDLGILHHIVTDRTARTASARSLAELCRREKLHGIQLDFENLHVSDRDAFTAFAREATDSVHRAGCELSAAVVPRPNDDRGTRPYHHYLYDYWRGAFDYKALADTLDFISYMTYAQHTGGSTPGPVAGFPWMVASLDYLLALGVPPSKISLGIPAYSDYWYPHYDPRTGAAHARGDDIGYIPVTRIVRDAGATPVWDDTQKAFYAMWETHGVFEHAWLEDARAFEAKLSLVRRHGLRGYSVWLLGLEDPRTFEVVGPVRR